MNNCVRRLIAVVALSGAISMFAQSTAEKPAIQSPETKAQDVDSSGTRSQRATEKATSLAKVIAAASKGGTFKPVSTDQLKKVERLFQRTILRLDETASRLDAASSPDGLVADWRRMRMNLHCREFKSSNAKERRTCWVLQESEDAKWGRGFYLFNSHAEIRQTAIQAPHSFFDKHTRAINVRMFETGQVAAAAWNTVRRADVDLAHHRFHYLNSFTSAWANVHSHGSVVQLHGFANDKRKTAAGKIADLIISDGTRYPANRVRRIATIAKEQLNASSHASTGKLNVMLYPVDCAELGATSNTQGKLLRDQGQTGFVHLEMSAKLRELLRRNASVTGEFLKSLLSIYRH